MSKFIPDPQIQQLRAMRAGDIAIAQATPAIQTIGKSSVAFAQPLVVIPIAPPPAVPAVNSPVATPNESPVIGKATATTLSQDALQSISAVAVESLETLAGTPSESPVVGVAFTTSVV
jgi:hypothetical protein